MEGLSRQNFTDGKNLHCVVYKLRKVGGRQTRDSDGIRSVMRDRGFEDVNTLDLGIGA